MMNTSIEFYKYLIYLDWRFSYSSYCSIPNTNRQLATPSDSRRTAATPTATIHHLKINLGRIHFKQIQRVMNPCRNMYVNTMALPLLFGGEWHEFDSQVYATTVFRQFETLCAVHEPEEQNWNFHRMTFLRRHCCPINNFQMFCGRMHNISKHLQWVEQRKVAQQLRFLSTIGSTPSEQQQRSQDIHHHCIAVQTGPRMRMVAL